VAVISSSAFFPGSLFRLNDAGRAFENKVPLPGNSVASRDTNASVLKTLSPQGLIAQQVLNGSASLSAPDVQTKPSLGLQLIDTLVRSGESTDDINLVTQSVQKSQETIDGLNDLQKKLNQSKKDDAQLRLDFAREQLRTLKLLVNLGTDPKIIAHSAADLGREIASAAREYAGVGASVDNSGSDASAQEDTSAAPDSLRSADYKVTASHTEIAASDAKVKTVSADVNSAASASNKPDATTDATSQDDQSVSGSITVTKDTFTYSASITYSASDSTSKPSEQDELFALDASELFAKTGAIFRYALEQIKQKKSANSDLDKIKDKFVSARREFEDSIKSILGDSASLSGSDRATAVDENIQIDVQVSVTSVNIVV
jgi:hypothetical protein